MQIGQTLARAQQQIQMSVWIDRPLARYILAGEADDRLEVTGNAVRPHNDNARECVEVQANN